MAVVWASAVVALGLVVVVRASVVATAVAMMVIVPPTRGIGDYSGWKGHRVCTESNLEEGMVTWVKEENFSE